MSRYYPHFIDEETKIQGGFLSNDVLGDINIEQAHVLP